MSIIISVFTIALIVLLLLVQRTVYLSVPCFMVKRIREFDVLLVCKWDRNEENEKITRYEVI